MPVLLPILGAVGTWLVGTALPAVGSMASGFLGGASGGLLGAGVTGLASGGLSGAIGSTLGSAALGAGLGAGTSALTGGDVGKGALMGAAGGGIGSIAGGALGLTNAGLGAYGRTATGLGGGMGGGPSWLSGVLGGDSSIDAGVASDLSRALSMPAETGIEPANLGLFGDSALPKATGPNVMSAADAASFNGADFWQKIADVVSGTDQSMQESAQGSRVTPLGGGGGTVPPNPRRDESADAILAAIFAGRQGGRMMIPFPNY